MMSGLVVAAEEAVQRPEVTRPRQTAGDRVAQPDWEQHVSVSVGPHDADIIGTTDKAIQAAVDYVTRLGGGTVRIKAGTYRLRNSVFLQSGLRLIGEGPATVLVKEPSSTTKLAEDSDWYDQEITLADANGFEIGDGVCLRAKDAKTGRQTMLKRTLVARRGARFKLDRALRENFWQLNGATAATLFPLLSGEFIEQVAIEDLVLDGNRSNNENLDGNHGGCIFLQDCNRVTIRRVNARNNNGDGISWQICHDVLVEHCVSENHAGLGLHPGSGSQRPIMRFNTMRGNDIGLFFCWGVKYGLALDNQIEGNRVGISIGHRDTDNLVTGNTVSASRAQGVLFRAERGPDFAGHRNRIENNVLIDNGSEKTAAIEINGGTQDVRLVGNRMEQKSPAEPRVGIRLGPDTQGIVVEGNRLTGFAQDIERSGKR
ncbi:MAG: right-handed parallel beta-helix repeat-containing protein [Verrucomicrobia bacterium]|nr:right-handed parallel beta-helix repeat-containing protein [Verrucomicrobiota bacterium]